MMHGEVGSVLLRSHTYTLVQIFSEVDERTRFIELQNGTRGNDDSIRGVRMEIATRMAELRGMGIDTSLGRQGHFAAHGCADPNQIIQQ